MYQNARIVKITKNGVLLSNSQGFREIQVNGKTMKTYDGGGQLAFLILKDAAEAGLKPGDTFPLAVVFTEEHVKAGSDDPSRGTKKGDALPFVWAKVA